MTQSELFQALEAVAPTAYLAFPEAEDGQPAQLPPFICYLLPGTDDVFADNLNYRRIYDLTVELYTSERDEDLTRQLDQVLTGLGIAYRREETWIESEKLYQTAYFSQVIFEED